MQKYIKILFSSFLILCSVQAVNAGKNEQQHRQKQRIDINVDWAEFYNHSCTTSRTKSFIAQQVAHVILHKLKMSGSQGAMVSIHNIKESGLKKNFNNASLRALLGYLYRHKKTYKLQVQLIGVSSLYIESRTYDSLTLLNESVTNFASSNRKFSVADVTKVHNAANYYCALDIIKGIVIPTVITSGVLMSLLFNY